MNQQTILPIDYDDQLVLDTFFEAGNRSLVKELLKLAEGSRDRHVLYLWGDSGCGKTHLLNACCTASREAGNRSMYLNAAQHARWPEVVRTVRDQVLVCVDDLESISGNPEAQASLLVIFEAVSRCDGAMLAAGKSPLDALGLGLKDLRSRLTGGGAYRLHALSDRDMKKMLKQRAQYRGFDLEDAVVEFILSRLARDTRSVFRLLDRLDRESLKSQRKVTIPLVRKLVDSRMR